MNPDELARKLGARVVPIEHHDCGCIMEAIDRVLIFERDDCTNRRHIAGRVVPDNPDYAYLRELGEPVA